MNMGARQSFNSIIYLAFTGLLFLTSCIAESDITPAEPPAQPPPADITAPRILDVSVVVTENNSVIVRWNTEEEATSEARLYDISSDKEIQAALDEKYVQRHVLSLDGNQLKADVTYSITLFSTDRAGNRETRYNAKMLSVNTLAAQNAAYRIFKLPALDGTQVSLADFKGKKVLLHFWIYGCHVCEEELPLFNALYNSMAQDEMPLLVICSHAEAGQVRDYLASRNLSLPVLVDQPGTVAIAYGVLTYPSTYIVETDGKVVKTKDGKFDYQYDIREFMGLRSYIPSL
jgi:peroxiredoxin